MKQTILTALFAGLCLGTSIGALARGNPASSEVKMEDGWIHRIFRARVLDMDKTARESLGFNPIKCRLLENIPTPVGGFQPGAPTVKVVFNSKFLTNCLFEQVKAGMSNASYRGVVETSVEMLGSSADDSLRTMRIELRPTEIFQPNRTFYERWRRRLILPVMAVEYYAIIDNFLKYFMSADLYLEFDKPIKLAAFGIPNWADHLIVGDPTKTSIKKLEVHTVQVQPTPQEPYRMKAMIIGYNQARQRELSLYLKFDWGLFHRSGLNLELEGK